MKTKAKKVVSHVMAGGVGFRCLNCGVEDGMGITFPARLNIWAEAGRTFEREHKACKPCEKGAARFKFTTPYEWKESWDTGISSETLWSFFTKSPVAKRGFPLDPSDFGRCYRLLKALPEWRARLGEFAASAPEPEWTRLVSRWGDLEKLYEEEVPLGSGKAPKLYGLIRELLASNGAGS